jgi:hypothetical protein
LIFRGNPEKFCEFVFPTIDKYKNGKIDFSEFMTAIALTHPGNKETRLHLVCIAIFIRIKKILTFSLH